MGLCKNSKVISWPCFGLHAFVFVSFLGSELNFLKLVASQVSGNETDRLALLEFKAKISNDPFGVLSSWNESVHFCQFRGVTCARRHQRVAILDLRSSKLGGSISPHIGNLSFLRELILYNNSFSHEIPPEIGRLRRLQYLELYNNSFTGKIPANISTCKNLIFISLAYNQLVGEIPYELGSLSKLQFISFSANNLSGNIPSSIGNLSYLDTLSLSLNSLDGRIPDSLGQLKNLTFLSLSANGLFGTIPSSIFNLSSIKTFHIGVNQIEGSLPSDLGLLFPSLRDFAIGDNHFRGAIPISLPNASNLEYFTAGTNHLTGKVHSLEKLQRLRWFVITDNGLGSGGADDDLSFLCSLTNVTGLEALAVNSNNFGGALPECIGNFSAALETLLLDHNQIIGNIPNGMESLVNLRRLDMWSNNFSGKIPSGIGKLQRLGILFLDGNSLSGNIPSSIGNLTRLIQLDFSDNILEGRIPSSLGQCKNLIYFDLSNNNLIGKIPPEVFGISSLSILLDLSGNQLTGNLPMEIGNLKNLGGLGVHTNMLSGEIPRSLGSCIVLELVDMHNNFFRGPIPSSLSSLRGIRGLDLSRNNLSGQIPSFFEKFDTLQILNLSYNNIEGEVPIGGVFKNVTATSLVGNNKLCGGIPDFQLPSCSFKSSKEKKLTLTLKLIISIVSGFLGIALLVSFLLLCYLRKKREDPGSRSTSEDMLWKVSYQSLSKATGGFSSANLMGSGSFGSVYKGIFDPDGKVIAVKVLNLLQHGASKSFMAECKALRNIRHRNLMKVLTACDSLDYQNNEFKALVYEFMANGSLDDWLHFSHMRNEIHEEPRKLDLLQRLNIAIDVACALDYLHHHCQPPIVHCDIKPSNVLLDQEITGHVGDFGLSRFLTNSKTSTSTNQTSSIILKGTVGYAAPEYGMGSEVSPYGDVYSYGIVLLEMFTGKRPTDDMFRDGLNLHNFVKEALPEGVKEIADPRIFWERTFESSVKISDDMCGSTSGHVIGKSLVSIFEIGVTCSLELPRARKNIAFVLAELRSVRDKLHEIWSSEGNKA